MPFIVLVILVPLLLLVSPCMSWGIIRAIEKHGTRMALFFMTIATLSRIILFFGLPQFDAVHPNSPILAILLLPDEAMSAPYFAFLDSLRGYETHFANVPAWIPITYLAVVYFAIFRIAGGVTCNLLALPKDRSVEILES